MAAQEKGRARRRREWLPTVVVVRVGAPEEQAEALQKVRRVVEEWAAARPGGPGPGGPRRGGP